MIYIIVIIAEQQKTSLDAILTTFVADKPSTRHVSVTSYEQSTTVSDTPANEITIVPTTAPNHFALPSTTLSIPASIILPSFPPALEGMVGLYRYRISSNQVPSISLQNDHINIYKETIANIPVRITTLDNPNFNSSYANHTHQRSILQNLIEIPINNSSKHQTSQSRNYPKLSTTLLRLPCFLLINSRSLLPKMDELALLLQVHPIEFVAVTETWLNALN